MCPHHHHGHEHPLHIQEESTHLVPVNEEGLVSRHTKVTYVDENGQTRTVVQASHHVAGCGHIVGNHPEELAAVCAQCSVTLCHRCAGNRCMRCYDILCNRCTRLFRGRGYCVRCWKIEIAKFAGWISLKGLGLALYWSGVGLLLAIKWTFIGLFRFIGWCFGRRPPSPPPGPPMIMR